MEAALSNAYSIWTYLVLIVGGIAIGQMFRGYRSKEDWRPLDQNIGFYFVTAMDLGMILGMAVWFLEGTWGGTEFLETIRRPALILTAWAAARYGWLRARQAPTAESKFGRAAMFFAISGFIFLMATFQNYGDF